MPSSALPWYRVFLVDRRGGIEVLEFVHGRRLRSFPVREVTTGISQVANGDFRNVDHLLPTAQPPQVLPIFFRMGCLYPWHNTKARLASAPDNDAVGVHVGVPLKPPAVERTADVSDY